MLRYFAGHPTAANLLILLLSVLGLTQLSALNRETFPDVDKYEVQVSVAYPGANPRDVEDGICRPLNDATDSISFIDEKRCEAKTNSGTMTLKMLENGNFDDFIDDVRSSVDGIDNFPENAETPIVVELGRTDPVVSVAITADLPASKLKDLGEVIKEKMQQDSGIPLVELTGFSQRQIRVELRAEKMRHYGVSISQIASRLEQQNLNLPIGDLETTGKDYSVRFDDERKTASEIGNIVIISADNGAEVKLKDISHIRDTFEDPENYVEFDGKRAVLIKVSKNSTDDSLNVLAAVERFIEAYQMQLPANVEFHLTQNSTSIVKDRLLMLADNAWQGLVLVSITLMLFFGFRYSFWVAMGLPVSFLASLFVMTQLGLSINMMSLVALLLAIGILMDDAIVIAESIASEIDKGKQALDAVVDGTKKVAKGVFSSYLTTVLVFGALLGLKGDLGQVLRVIPMVLITVISVSLIEAFLILPAHLYHVVKHGKPKESKVQVVVNRWLDKQKERLGRVVTTAIQYRYAVIGSTIGLFFISAGFIASGYLKFNSLPEIDGDVVEARVIMPAGTPLSETQNAVNEILVALEKTNVELSEKESTDLLLHTSVLMGQNIDAFEEGAHVATVSVDLLTAELRQTDIDDFIDRWLAHSKAIKGIATLSLTEPTLGPKGRAIELRLSGLDLDTLSKASYELQGWLSGYEGVYNVFNDLRPGKPEVYLHYKPSVYSLGIDAQSIATQLRSALSGFVTNEVYRGRDDFELTVQLDQQQSSLEALKQFPIVHPKTNQLIPLANLVDMKLERDVSRIQRINNIRTVTVYGSVNTLVANTEEVVADALVKTLPNLQQSYPGLKVTVKGEVDNSAITKSSLRKGLVLGLLGVFVLLSFQFRSYSEPLLVMTAIPLAFIGVIFGHVVMGHALSMPSMVGFVSLSGIVVNNAILLVEFIKHHVASGESLKQAASLASKERLRAIILTTSTTIAGMLPLLFETSLQAQVLIPLVISIAFGLLVSTVMILIVLPCTYTVLEDYKNN